MFAYDMKADLTSSFIKTVYYSSAANEMAVEMLDRKESYVYKEVPKWLFESFTQSASPGAYYNRNIRGIYPSDWIYELNFVSAETPQKSFVIRAVVPIEANVTASSLEEAVEYFMKQHQDVDGIKVKEVVVSFE